ncbi:MAG: selenoprotein B glycine/betaine/sarcosine/D-proline reductase [bacterium]|nr:selenoprotein B glycine/betaine/sarcosine/D-proline reductase [bacterium]
MVRLADIPEVERVHLLAKGCAPFDSRPWVEGTPLSKRRVAIVTSAGLHRVEDQAFSMVDLSYRVIPGSIRADDLTMTHSSVHFDRVGFREDVNLVFPIDRLRELESEGVIGSVADYHYSLMGAGWLPKQIEPTMRELARLLREDEVDAVCLVPV